MKCSRCGEFSATSIATGLCSLCLYADAMGAERAARQRQLAENERKRKRPAKDRAK